MSIDNSNAAKLNDCLEILDRIEDFRHKNETTASHNDHTIRI